MKTNKIFVVLAMGLALAACTSNGPKSEAAKALAPSKAQVDSVSYLIGINFGSFIKGYNFGADLNYSEIEKGIKDFVNAEGDFREMDFGKQFKIDPNLMNDVFNSYLEKRQKLVQLENKEKGEAFLAANAKKAGVVTTESGLQYKIIEPGNDVKASTTDTVYVHYKGTLIDGTTFDEVPADAEPISFALDHVIAGWTEGIQLIGEGGKIELYVPSHLAYGEQGNQAIEPNSTLIFNVDLTKVSKAVAE